MSRPKKKYTSEEIAQVEALAAHGHTQAEITEFLGIKDTSFRCARKENEALNAAYKRGKFKAHNHVVSRLMRYINNDELSAVNLNAISLYLRTQGGWSEKSQLAVTTKDVTPKLPTFIFNFSDDWKNKRKEEELKVVSEDHTSENGDSDVNVESDS